MKALVLCGAAPQIHLTECLHSRGITVVMADMNESVVGRKYADIFYPVSVFDSEAIKQVAIKENVDFIITVCADQVLEIVAKVSEELGLPCYISYETAQNVSRKSYMKKLFVENDIPTSRHVVLKELDLDKISHLDYPLVVKPIDSYSSRGVSRVSTAEEMETAFKKAKDISRASTVVVEEFAEGEEISVDFFVEDGVANYITSTISDKIFDQGFLIHRSRNPAIFSKELEQEIKKVGQKISDAFGIKNSPMFAQLITDGKKLSVIEFCARTGGSIKFRLIKNTTGFDVIKAVVDLTLGEKPNCEIKTKAGFLVNEFLYCNDGVLDHLEGFEELVREGIIKEYHQFKSNGSNVGGLRNSGDRVASFTIHVESIEKLRENHAIANKRIKIIGTNGEDLLRHDLLSNLNEKQW